MKESNVDNIEQEFWSFRTYLTEIQGIVSERNYEQNGQVAMLDALQGIIEADLHVGFIAVPVPQTRIGQVARHRVVNPFTVHAKDNNNGMIDTEHVGLINIP